MNVLIKKNVQGEINVRKLMLVALLAMVFMVRPEAEANAQVGTYVDRVDSWEVTGFRSEKGTCGADYVFIIPPGPVIQHDTLHFDLDMRFTYRDDAPSAPPMGNGPVILFYDGLGNLLNPFELDFGMGIGPSAEITINYQQIGFNENRSVFYRPITIVLFEIVSQSVLAQTTFDPADFDSSCASMPYANSVEISEVSDVTQDASIYVGTDDDGNESLDVYGINNEGEGYFLFDITQADLAPFVDNPPAQNTELESVDNVTLYILTTGEYQLNIGPDEEGKVRVIVFDGLPPTNVYSYDFNVYDILNGNE